MNICYENDNDDFTHTRLRLICKNKNGAHLLLNNLIILLSLILIRVI